MAGPDFIGIGMQKSGTTYVYEALKRHPSIDFPAHPARFDFLADPVVDGRVLSTLPKEIQFLHGPNAGLGWETYLRIFADAPAGLLQGEISPSYAEAPPDRIVELAQRCPGVRLFAILRDPVLRDWSAIRMIAARCGVLNDDDELMRIADFDHVRRMGDYAAALLAWLAVFPRQAFAFATNEALDRDPQAIVAGIAAHIGADPDELPAVSEGRVFRGPERACPARLAAMLRERHADQVEAVAALTGLDLDDWTGGAQIAAE